MTSATKLFSSHQIRDFEQLAVSQLGMTEQELMSEAGFAAFTTLKQLYPDANKIIVYCGSGNNAGDGYVLARLAHKAGYTVIVNYYKPFETLPETAQSAALLAVKCGVSCHYMEDMTDFDADLIVDALLGTGLTGTVKEPIANAINQINSSGIPVLAMDIPSGINADTGQCMGQAVHASVTVTFIGYKTGMLTLDGPDYCGEIIGHDLGIDTETALIPPMAKVIKNQWADSLLPSRKRNSHKGDFGHVLIIGGGSGMPGSVCLAAQAALRVGAGMVTIATKPEYAQSAQPGLLEAMIYGIEKTDDLDPLLAKATVCVIGPGLGTDQWAEQLFKHVLACQLPMVIDASALRILATAPLQDDNWILTPHPGEAAALLGCSTNDIQNNRYAAIVALQKKYGGNIILKGVGTLIQGDEPVTYVCAAGNPGMASAGMGDVLSGVIAGLVAQRLALADAARLGVWIHAHAGDLAARKGGERGLIASDLIHCLRLMVNP